MHDAKPLRVLGIDPGLRVAGYGCITYDRGDPRPILVEAGAIKLDTTQSVSYRLYQLWTDINEIITFHISAQKSKMENWMNQLNDIQEKKSAIELSIKRLELFQDSIVNRMPQIVSYKLEHKLSLLSMTLVMIFSFAINVVFLILLIRYQNNLLYHLP